MKVEVGRRKRGRDAFAARWLLLAGFQPCHISHSVTTLTEIEPIVHSKLEQLY